MRRGSLIRAAGLVLCLTTLSATAVLAQSNATDAALEGTSATRTAAPFPARRCRARSMHTNIARTATTDERGYYRFRAAADRRVRAGSQPRRLRRLPPDRRRARTSAARCGVDVRLAIRALQETVTVVADAAVADASQVAIQGVVNERAVRTLPIVSRNLYNLSLQAPGVKGPAEQRLRHDAAALRRHQPQHLVGRRPRQHVARRQQADSAGDQHAGVGRRDADRVERLLGGVRPRGRRPDQHHHAVGREPDARLRHGVRPSEQLVGAAAAGRDQAGRGAVEDARRHARRPDPSRSRCSSSASTNTTRT